MTSVGFVIVGGLTSNEGVVIARDPQGTNHTTWLTDEQWFIAQTNRDVWEVTDDSRYNATVSYMNSLG